MWVKIVTCSFSSSSNGNGSMAESFNENDSDYVNSSVVEAVEVKSGPDGFIIEMRDGKHLKCTHNNPQGSHLPDYAPHPAIVLKMEDGTCLLLPIMSMKLEKKRAASMDKILKKHRAAHMKAEELRRNMLEDVSPRHSHKFRSLHRYITHSLTGCFSCRDS